MDFEADSAISIVEDQLAQWLFTGFPAWRCIERDLRPPTGCSPFFKVDTQRIAPAASGPGDIDVLLSSPQTPELSIAIELKRVKISRDSFHTDSPNKLGGLRHGVQQANLLQQLGFYRNYLLVAIVADGRARAEENFAFRGAKGELLKKIYQFHGRDELAAAVGLLFVELTQPVDKPIGFAGSIIVNEVRPAKAQEQPLPLTKAIVRLFQGRNGIMR